MSKQTTCQNDPLTRSITKFKRETLEWSFGLFFSVFFLSLRVRTVARLPPRMPPRPRDKLLSETCGRGPPISKVFLNQ